MRKGEATRERIIETAAQVFNVHGFHGGSMAELMAQTGLKKGGIYNHFSSKEELALAAFDHAVSLILKKINEAVRPHKTPEKRINALLEYFLRYALHPPVEGGCPIMNTLTDSEGTNPALKARAKAALEKVIRRLAGLIQQGIDAGEFHTATDAATDGKTPAQTTAETLFAMLEGGILLTRAFDDIRPMELIVGQIRAMLLKAPLLKAPLSKAPLSQTP